MPNPELCRDRRLAALQGISGQRRPSCMCCGERRLWCLVLDHIDNGGNAHRKANGGTNTLALVYRELRAEGAWPRHRYRILCANCNGGRRITGAACPHTTERFFMHTRDKLVAGFAASVTALQALLVAFNVVTPSQGSAIAAVVVAFLAGYRTDRGGVEKHTKSSD